MDGPSPLSASAPVAPPAAPSPASFLVKPANSSVPPLKSPMPRTFYRNSAPTAPPFVKADQSGTILEVLAEDQKRVSVDTPLFAIQPYRW